MLRRAPTRVAVKLDDVAELEAAMRRRAAEAAKERPAGGKPPPTPVKSGPVSALPRLCALCARVRLVV